MARVGRPPSANPESRQRLLAAAQTLMSEQPAAQVSLRAVAELAGYDPALLTYYFSSKSGLIRAVLEDAAGRVTERLATVQAHSGTVAERLKLVIQVAIEAGTDMPYLSRLVLQQVLAGSNDPEVGAFVRAVGLPYIETVQAIVHAGKEAAELRDIDDRLLVYALSALPMLLPLLEPLFADGPTHRDGLPAHMTDAVVEVLLNGVLAHDSSR